LTRNPTIFPTNKMCFKFHNEQILLLQKTHCNTLTSVHISQYRGHILIIISVVQTLFVSAIIPEPQHLLQFIFEINNSVKQYIKSFKKIKGLTNVKPYKQAAKIIATRFLDPLTNEKPKK